MLFKERPSQIVRDFVDEEEAPPPVDDNSWFKKFSWDYWFVKQNVMEQAFNGESIDCRLALWQGSRKCAVLTSARHRELPPTLIWQFPYSVKDLD